MALPSLVKVVWIDAWSNKEDEVTLEDVASTHVPTKVTTIGWLLLEDDEGVSVANETYEGKYRGRTFIPKSLVKSVEPLIKPRKARHAKTPPASNATGNSSSNSNPSRQS